MEPLIQKVPNDMELLSYIVSFIEKNSSNSEENPSNSDNSSENHYKIRNDNETHRKLLEEINPKNPKRNRGTLVLDWNDNHNRKIQMVIALNKSEMFIHQVSINDTTIFQCRRFSSENTYIFQV